MSQTIAPGFWRGRRVLVTGHTGFKGSWLCLLLHRLGAEVTGIALPPLPGPSAFAALRIAPFTVTVPGWVNCPWKSTAPPSCRLSK